MVKRNFFYVLYFYKCLKTQHCIYRIPANDLVNIYIIYGYCIMYIIYLIFDKFPTINCLWCQKDRETPVIYGNHQIAKLKLIYIFTSIGVMGPYLVIMLIMVIDSGSIYYLLCSVLGRAVK